MSTLHIVDHPLVQHKLSIMRNKKKSKRGFIMKKFIQKVYNLLKAFISF